MCKDHMDEIIRKVVERDQWPTFEDSAHLSELDAIAEDANAKDTLEGYLAALAIYHQLCDEMAKLLIEDSRFLFNYLVFLQR